jgi:glutamate dehydrogenase/leucine dehydrogenase
MGNVGGNAAKFFAGEGAKIVAVGDSSGAVVCERGLDVAELLEHLKTQMVKDYNADGVKHISGSELLTTDCDILIPAALENQITEANANKICARYIIEGANGPTVPAADKVLQARGVTVVPDILANAGGVIVSYFEWLQNLASEHWTLEQVNAKLAETLTAATTAVYDMHEAKDCTLRTAAYMIALKRLVEASKAD